MKLHEMEHLIGEAVRDADLRPEEIPAIDLYLDQIISLVTDKRMEGSAHYRDRELTKTMINNYSKDGLIAPIKGKKYSKEHIIQMLLVYDLKNTLSIGEIKRILQNVYALPAYSEEMLESSYNRFLDIKADLRATTENAVGFFIERSELDVTDDADFFTALLGLAAASSYIKDSVRALLAERYPDLSAEREREEQERRAQVKREKADRKEEKKEEKKAAAKAKKEEPKTEAPLADGEQA